MNSPDPIPGQRRPRRQGGFTLIETMVAVAITGVMSIALAQMMQVAQRSSDRNRILVEMQQNARVGLQSLSDDLRHVSYGKDPTQPSINFAGPDSVTFVADLMPELVGAERISFYLSPDGDPDTPNPTDTVLMRVVADTAGVVLLSAPQAYGVAPGGLSFRWFNGGGVELANPVPQPEQIGEVFVSLTVASSRTIGSEYATLALNSTIYPRNLPLSPARSRPSSPSCGSLTFPNCEAATMSWTTPTTNTDGTELLLGDISHFTVYFGIDPDDMSLYTKLARTINQWTINGLSDGGTYYFAVACVSRSGVESYPCGQEADMSSTLIPEAPISLYVTPFPGGGGLHPGLQLNWPPVTLFTSGEPVTTPINYVIYRGTSAGFIPGAGNRLATVILTTTFVDSTLTSCVTPYYQVRAKACGNEGLSSPEEEGQYPAPPSFPTGLAGAPATQAGDVDLSWSHPAHRTDYSLLDPDQIQGYRVYVDTVAGNTTSYVDIPGSATTTTMTGLESCTTYYFNVQCVDDCGHPGDFLSGNEIAVMTTAPCDPDPPEGPATLTVTASDNRIDLEWPAATESCDLSSYRIYYGATAGGPYDGTGAAQGDSPIEVDAASVLVGNVCRYTLSELEDCEGWYAVVSALDYCAPPNESELSPEQYGMTTCTACGIETACTGWAVAGPGNAELNLEIFTSNSGGETVTRLTPTYNSAALVREVWFGEPQVKVWAYDGSAGHDGYGDPQPSGAVLNVTDFVVPASSLQRDGVPVRLVFNQDVRSAAFDLVFRGYSGTCTASGTGSGASRIDDFNDGNYGGWTSVTGSWSASTGYAWENSTSSNYILKDSSLNLGNLTFEAKIQASGGTQHGAYLAFRYQDSSNYYICGIRTDLDVVQVGRIQSNNWVATPASYSTPLSDGTWYTLRVVVTGSRIQAWLNCQSIIDVTDTSMWATGGLALSTRKARGGFDDVKIYSGTVLP